MSKLGTSYPAQFPKKIFPYLPFIVFQELPAKENNLTLLFLQEVD
jgi:hypothetical protein